MTLEEKAKAYDKVMKAAVDAYKYDKALKAAVVAHKDEDKHLKATLEIIFPELKENDESERIKKAIIDIIKSQKEQQCHIDSTIYDEMIAWLEKQDKQKLTWSEEDEKVRKALKEAGYEWSEETHDLKKIEQNLAWSEEDDAYKLFAISAVKDYYDKENPLQKNLVDWLKSLKERIGG